MANSALVNHKMKYAWPNMYISWTFVLVCVPKEPYNFHLRKSLKRKALGFSPLFLAAQLLLFLCFRFAIAIAFTAVGLVCWLCPPRRPLSLSAFGSHIHSSPKHWYSCLCLCLCLSWCWYWCWCWCWYRCWPAFGFVA